MPMDMKNQPSPACNTEDKNDKVVDKTLSHDSVGLVFGLAFLGLASTIFYYHTFDLTVDQPYNLFTLFISVAMILLTSIDILVSCRNYGKRAIWKGTTKTLAIISIVLAGFLLLVAFLYCVKLVVVDSQYELHLSKGNLSDWIDKICAITGYLPFKSYLFLYPVNFLLQTLANVSRLLLKRRPKPKQNNGQKHG